MVKLRKQLEDLIAEAEKLGLIETDNPAKEEEEEAVANDDGLDTWEDNEVFEDPVQVEDQSNKGYYGVDTSLILTPLSAIGDKFFGAGGVGGGDSGYSFFGLKGFSGATAAEPAANLEEQQM